MQGQASYYTRLPSGSNGEDGGVGDGLDVHVLKMGRLCQARREKSGRGVERIDVKMN